MLKMKKCDYRFYLKLEKNKAMLMLRESLVYDGKFYGAEWIDE